MKNVFDLVGRFFIASIFIFEAYDTIAYVKQTKETMSSYGLNWNQDLLVYISIVFLVLGGILLITGYRIKLGAFLLLLYWLPVTFIMYSFWNDPLELQRINSINFMKNLGIAGALLLLIVNGSGKFSIKRIFSVTKIRSDDT